MSILYNLKNQELWYEFLEHKVLKEQLSANQAKELEAFINKKGYLPLANKIITGGTFDCPTAKMINKNHSAKKRMVFVFSQDENYILKMIGFLLYKYDNLFANNLYSFQKNKSPKHAIKTITQFLQSGQMFSYKLDIKDYFASVNPQMMASVLKSYITDEPFVNFVISLLQNPYCILNEEQIKAPKGIMAGMPISGFLANLYLTEMDKWFEKNNVLYARYSDDIIVFAKTKNDIEAYKEKIHMFLNKYSLCTNTQKECLTYPGDKWEYLGFSHFQGSTDISDIALSKIKGKIKRKARAILRWKTQKNATNPQALRAFIKHFNKKFYLNPIHNELTWCKWYFPTISTDKSLKEIDSYMIRYIRYIQTGKHTKSNYNLQYKTIKELGFKSLVNEYYKFKSGKYGS